MFDAYLVCHLCTQGTEVVQEWNLAVRQKKLQSFRIMSLKRDSLVSVRKITFARVLGLPMASYRLSDYTFLDLILTLIPEKVSYIDGSQDILNKR